MESLLDADPATLPLSSASKLHARLRASAAALIRRAPPPQDATRWRHASINGKALRFAQPITLTPYASVQPCSARCRFCSETLRTAKQNVVPARLRPDDAYFPTLRRALALLHEVPLSWSLSGLESTDDPAWFLQLLDTLTEAERGGVVVEQRVLYSNGAGFARDTAIPVDALAAFRMSWVELSRHHPDQQINQSIMRFRDGETIAANAAFERVAGALAARLPLRMVCIVQRGGVDDADGVSDYLDWAARCGATTVIFREFSRMDDTWIDNGTRRYIDGTRIHIDSLLEQCMASPCWSALTPASVTEGYYFWNVRLRHASGMEVVFEASDYGVMERQHASGDVYKLVFFANGKLCSGWQPDRNVLWDARHG